MDPKYADFTETEYRSLLMLAKKNWRFVPFRESMQQGKICLWRHDIDLSVHRAARLAHLEADEGLRATYFVLPHSTFYNILEREVRDLLRTIAHLGHDVGLHFDARFYDIDRLEPEGVKQKIAFEKAMLETAIDVPIVAVSYHDGDQIPPELKLQDDHLVGLVNAHSRYIRERFGYCSDSNGYWRYRRLRDVLEANEDERLHVLTHPGWWVPEAMSPRDRISRCIDGRVIKQHRTYDIALEKIGRINMK